MPQARKRAMRCRRRPWSDLPQELLDLILDRLTPAFGDRIRFRGVCRAWRATEHAHPRPPMPWLVAPGHCVSLHDAAIHRVPLPEDAAAAACLGSFDDWLALVPASGCPFLLNAFTMERIKLPRLTKDPMSKIVKIVLSSAPDSKGCTAAAIVENEDDDEVIIESKIFVCRLRGTSRFWWPITTAFELEDIIFFEGRLHALDAEARVHVFEDGELERLRREPWSPPGEVARRFNDAKLHLVALNGRLRMLGRGIGKIRAWGIGKIRVPVCTYYTYYTSSLGVFALDGDTAKRPAPLKDFDGHAIFVGDACCRAFPVDAASGGKVRANQFCFVDDEKNMPLLAVDGRRAFRVLHSYDVRNVCLRKYQPSEPSPAPGPGKATASSGAAAGAWRCVTAQRFPYSGFVRPPPRAPLSGAELLLWGVTECLGVYMPYYSSRKHERDDDATAAAGHHAVTVHVDVPKRLFRNYVWRFTRRGRTAREARQAAAHEAVTFLRSRFRGVLDDSPWSSVPHYHSRVVDKEEEGPEEEDYSDDDSDSDDKELFSRFEHWYLWCSWI